MGDAGYPPFYYCYIENIYISPNKNALIIYIVIYIVLLGRAIHLCIYCGVFIFQQAEERKKAAEVLAMNEEIFKHRVKTVCLMMHAI